VGSEECSNSRGKCNGKLKPGTIHRFKVRRPYDLSNADCLLFQIRAYTDADKFSETAWSQPISTDPDNTAILVGITVPIVLLVLVLLAFVLIRKAHCPPCGRSGKHHRDHPADLVSIKQTLLRE